MPCAPAFVAAAREMVPTSPGPDSQQVLKSAVPWTIANKEAVLNGAGALSLLPPLWLYTLAQCRGSRQKCPPSSFSLKEAGLHSFPVLSECLASNQLASRFCLCSYSLEH